MSAGEQKPRSSRSLALVALVLGALIVVTGAGAAWWWNNANADVGPWGVRWQGKNAVIPDGITVLVFELRNHNEQAYSVELALGLPEGFELIGFQRTAAQLAPDQSERFFFSVRTPAKLEAGDYDVTFQAKDGVSGRPLFAKTLPLRVARAAIPHIEAQSRRLKMEQGNTFTYRFDVVNRGNKAGIFKLKVGALGNLFRLEHPSQTHVLQPGEKEQIDVLLVPQAEQVVTTLEITLAASIGSYERRISRRIDLIAE